MALSGSAGGKDGWSSRTAFVLAAIGAAVGLGNIWRFPTVAGENGGGAFVLVYIAFVALIGAPLVLSEVLIGRNGGKDAAGSVAEVASRSGASRKWGLFGGVEILSAFLILSFYSVVAGWALNYALIMGGDLLSNAASGQPFSSAFQGEGQDQIAGRMGDLFASPWRMIGLHVLFMGVTIWIVANGVHSGIERAATWLMPAFFGLLLLLTLYGALTGDLSDTLAFLFTPDFSKLSPQAVNEALGQALFSLSLSSAALITYGAYLPAGVRLAPMAGMIAIADTLVAIIAGLMIFPIVFAAGLDPAAGPVLVFQSLPVAFAEMPAGSLIGFAFFVLIFFAALTSSISLLEGPVAWALAALGWGRRRAALAIGGFSFLIGVACVLGYSVWSDVRPLAFWSIFENADILDSLDGFTGKVMLPFAALGIALFTGWIADRRLVEAESGLSGPMFVVWRALVAFLAPVAVALVLVFGLFPGLLA